MPNIRELPNKPLVEAILELRWFISPEQGDSHYTLFPGRLYDRVQSRYPFHEPLPASMVPQPVALNIVQHRFRSKENAWPLIQIGPGIITLNDTEGYTWKDFGQRASKLVQDVYEAYPMPEELRVISLALRYIDAIQFDYAKSDVLDFLGDKLKTRIVLSQDLFDGVPVDRAPTGFDLHITFAASKPKGSIAVRFGTGTHREKPAVIWETTVGSRDNDLPKMPDKFGEWVEAAHSLTDDWFFKLIQGELERRFASDK